MSGPFPWAPENAETRLETAFARVTEDPASESVFLKLLEVRGQGQAKSATGIKHPLSGALINLKALFDVKGEVTTSATKVLANDPSAQADADLVQRLDAAGSVFVGLTNMSEFAYSGLGLNPHYGTPQNVKYPACAPGGSSSGGAVAVALGLSDIAIGSDTGGSLRIPAAFNGIVGFKPTQNSVPMTGGKPLSCSLDSFGPMAASVDMCELAWQVMAGREPVYGEAKRPRFIIPTNFGFDEIDKEVASGFERMTDHLTEEGFDVRKASMPSIDLYADIPPVAHDSGGIARVLRGSLPEVARAV